MNGRHHRPAKPTSANWIPAVRDKMKLRTAGAGTAGSAIGVICLLLLKQKHRRLILWSVPPRLDGVPSQALQALAEFCEIVALVLPDHEVSLRFVFPLDISPVLHRIAT